MKRQKLNHQEILSNRAKATGGEDQFCDSCGERLVFAMECGEQRFSLGLTTILECLRAAEINGHIPEIDIEWWRKVGGNNNNLHTGVIDKYEGE